MTTFLDARNKFKTFISQSYLLAPNTACVVSKLVAPGTFVEANTPILITTTATGAYPDIIPVFINSEFIADIKVGNESIVTPVGFSTTQFGGIKGEVIEISETTQSVGEILKTVGIDTIVQSIQKSYNSPFLVLVKLKKSTSTSSGYEWTSSIGPDFKIPITSMMNATIITKRVSPASMALPALRNLFTSNPIPLKEVEN
jgi:HlyD family secretion protein